MHNVIFHLGFHVFECFICASQFLSSVFLAVCFSFVRSLFLPLSLLLFCTQLHLAHLYFWGSQGMQRNLQAARHFFQQGAAQGDTDSLYNLGLMDILVRCCWLSLPTPPPPPPNYFPPLLLPESYRNFGGADFSYFHLLLPSPPPLPAHPMPFHPPGGSTG